MERWGANFFNRFWDEFEAMFFNIYGTKELVTSAENKNVPICLKIPCWRSLDAFLQWKYFSEMTMLSRYCIGLPKKAIYQL